MSKEKVLFDAIVVYLVIGNESILGTDKIILPLKTDKIGKGRRNGYGGGPEPEDGNSLLKTGCREIREESDNGGGGVIVNPADIHRMGVVYCNNLHDDGRQTVCRLRVAFVWRWSGKPESTEEMSDPRMYSINRMPWEETIPSDRDWLPYMLEGHKLYAWTYLAKRQTVKRRPSRILFVDEIPMSDFLL